MSSREVLSNTLALREGSHCGVTRAIWKALIPSARWRGVPPDSLAVRELLGLALPEALPDRSTISRARDTRPSRRLVTSNKRSAGRVDAYG